MEEIVSSELITFIADVLDGPKKIGDLVWR